MDRLRLRLGQVLGAQGDLDTGAAGELRVRPRNTAPLAHGHPRRPAARARGAAPLGQAKAAGAHWGYAGSAGPDTWGRLKPEFAKCATGQRQSPIDIRDGIGLDIEALQFDYRPGSFSVIDTGQTVQVNLAPGNFVEVLGRRYALQQFHFHRPSEERIDGRRFDMTVHLVHKDAEGRLAVVAVLLERGAAQPLLQAVWNNLPLEKGEEQPARVHIDPGQLLPEDRRYYTYMGSMTTPPCNEGVLWMVMRQPVTLSAAQLDIFARLYPMNARPTQSAAGRLIKQSN
jgi:carbonic anhydrase